MSCTSSFLRSFRRPWIPEILFLFACCMLFVDLRANIVEPPEKLEQKRLAKSPPNLTMSQFLIFQPQVFTQIASKRCGGEGANLQAVHLSVRAAVDPRKHLVCSTMLQFLPSGDGRPSLLSPSGRQHHPLLLWFNLLDGENGPLLLLYSWLSLGAYYLLLLACSWFVLQWFRRGRPWARARSLLMGKSLAAGGGEKQQQGQQKRKQKRRHEMVPQLLYMDSARNRQLLSKTTVLRQPYVPTPWLGHRVSCACFGSALMPRIIFLCC